MRRNAVAIVVGTLCLLVVARLSFPPPPVRTDRQAFARIQLGMSLPEVEEVIGGPPGNYAPSYHTFLHNDVYERYEGKVCPDCQKVIWRHEAGQICLRLNEEQRVRFNAWKSVDWTWDRTSLRHFLPWHWW